MKLYLLKTMLLLCALVAGSERVGAATTYEQLTSIANIDESAQYVLGIDGTGFHYGGTSSWGTTALPSAQTPLFYTLTKANDGSSFTAKTTISGTTYYLQIPTSNTFSMSTSTGTNTDIIIGTTQVSETNYAVANKSTTARHLRINGTSGLRSYAGTTGSMAFFYKVVKETAYTVTFSDGGSLTEETGGAGVTLPTRSAIGNYSFAGWSTVNIQDETTAVPTIIPAGTYHPTKDITLYPIYTRTESGSTTNKTATVNIAEYASANNWSNGTMHPSISLDDNIKATASGNGSNTGKYYTSGNSWRIYYSESGKLTLTASNGAQLTSATISFSNNTLSFGGSNIRSGNAVNLSGTSAEFVAGGITYITAISVDYTVSDGSTNYYWSTPVSSSVERPVIDVAETFNFSTLATITCATEGTTIYCRLSEEGEWSEYISPLNITATTTIYAKAVLGDDESPVVSKTTTKELPIPTVTINGELITDIDGETNIAAGTLTALVTYNDANVEGSTVTWSSSNTNIATIDANSGAVVLLKTGEVTFTATYSGNNDYAEATGTKTITVVDSNVPGATPENLYTVADVINGTATGSDIYVKGFIVGEYVGDTTNPRTSGFTTDANIAIADEFTSSPTAGASIPVQLGTDALKNAWGCKTSSGSLLGYEVLIKGNKETYFSVNGIKNTSEVTAISMPVTLTAANYATFSNASATDFSESGITVYKAKVNGNVVKLTTVNDGVVPANTGVILYSASPVTKNVPFTTTNATGLDDNEMVATITRTQVTKMTGDNYNYILQAGPVFNMATEEGGYMPAGKAYLSTSYNAGDPDDEGGARMSIVFDDEAQGISAMQNKETKNYVVFDLQGRRVVNAAKGLYIVNGKKMLVK